MKDSSKPDSEPSTATRRAQPAAPRRAQGSPTTLTPQIVQDVLRRTRSRTVEYLCRAYLQFGCGAMSPKDLERLCAAINLTYRKDKTTP